MHSPDFDDDIIPVEYLFRDFSDMPKLEQIALKQCKGKVLDVGCGAGSHALFLQNNQKLETYALDNSQGAIEITRKRGVLNTLEKDFFSLSGYRFDTILMLMNGSGIIGKLENLEEFFRHSKSILNVGGQIIMDSSDLIYLFDDEIDNTEKYYGEFEFSLSYKGLKSDSFNWLYIDPELLMQYAEANGFKCKILETGENYDYLAVLEAKTS